MTRVAGVDTSTQSCKVVVCEAETGRIVRQGATPHPQGTSVHPDAWWDAFERATQAAGGLADVEAMSVGGQQHGLVMLDDAGAVIRDALLWNDVRSAAAAAALVEETGAPEWARAVGSVPLASFTVAKLRWVADHEPENLRRLAAVALPHDWLTWRIAGAPGLDALVTDRSDASGTGYFDAGSDRYRRDLFDLAVRRTDAQVVLPRVLDPFEAGPAAAGTLGKDIVLGPGAGDNAAATLGLGLTTGMTSVSLGTSGVVASVSETPACDPTGLVAGFADATGHYLPLACTLNAARVLDVTAATLGVDADGFSDLALAASPGADGLVFVPYLEGERTPNLPDATGSLHGMTLASMTRPNLARAAVEGVLCLMAEGLAAVRAQGVTVDSVTLTGGAARSAAVRRLAPAVLGLPVDLPVPGEYVALGAARQAAAVLTGRLPEWDTGVRRVEADADPSILENYRRYRPWTR